MTEADLISLLPKLEAFHGQFHRFFCRSEGRRWALRYLTGLLLSVERKNIETLRRKSAHRLAVSSSSSGLGTMPGASR